MEKKETNINKLVSYKLNILVGLIKIRDKIKLKNKRKTQICKSLPLYF